MKILVLNDREEEFSSIAALHPRDDLQHAQRYLQFLQEIENSSWDIIYIDDDLSEHPTCDVWTDGSGFKRMFDGIHAARAIASLKDINRCPTEAVVVTAKNTDSAFKMCSILKQSCVKVTRNLLR